MSYTKIHSLKIKNIKKTRRNFYNKSDRKEFLKTFLKAEILKIK